MKDRIPVLFALTLCGIVFAVAARNALSDDAYITLRVVRHALEGDGLRYNPGDSGVQPATSPLNLMLLLAVSAALSLLGTGVETGVLTAPLIVAIIALPAFGCAMYLLMCGDKRNSPIAAAAAALAIAVPISLMTIGLETLMAMALCMGALLAYRSRTFGAMGWLLGLAFLARHDAVILAGILYFLYWREVRLDKSAKPLSAMVGFLAVVAPWVVFSLLYYGVATPTTLESKTAQGGTAYWPAWYPTMLGHWLQVYFFGSMAVVWAFALAAIGGVAGALWKRTRASLCVLLFALYQLLVLGAYSAMAMPDYHWYFVPYAVTLVLLTGWWLTVFSGNTPGRAATLVAVLCVAGVTVAMLRVAPAGHGPVWASYREAGRYLEANPPQTAAGFMEIGIIGFYAPSVRVFDFAGVATLEQAERVSRNAAHEWLQDPTVADVVVIRGVRHPLEPDFNERFEAAYEHEWTGTPTEAFPNGLQIWRLR